jgi:peptidoglycan pentaglycine glycine transferase (the first glycine)
MRIVEIKDQTVLDGFVSKIERSPFHQSFGWGEFQKRAGNDVVRAGIKEDEKLIAAATFIVKKLPLGLSYLYCPRGPVLDFRMSPAISTSFVGGIPHIPAQSGMREIFDFRFGEIWKIIREHIYNLAKAKNAIFLRYEPQFEFYSKIKNQKLKIYKSLDVQPSKTLVLDLSKIKEELLSEMHPKTRYNIRLAEKKGVKVQEAHKFAPPSNIKSFDLMAASLIKEGGGSAEEFEKFWHLMEETVERDKFRLHNKEYYRKMLNCDFIKLYFAEYEGSVLAAAIIAFFGDTATYLHGASSDRMRNLMAPFLLHWSIAEESKKNGFKYYDFNGIDEKKWPGVTRFKKGFGGFESEYPGTFDLVFNNLGYSAYKAARSLKRK